MNERPTSAELAVFRALIEAMLEEMGEALCHGAFSQNIKERRDYSCALFDSSGDLICGANHIPVHLGSMDTSCKAAINSIAMHSGDAVILNDPFSGGTHLPDITCIFPFFADVAKRPSPLDRRPDAASEPAVPTFYLGARAHHSDVGGIAPGSLPLSKTLGEEGLIIKPKLILKSGELVKAVIDELRHHSRQPDERAGDMRAQIASGAVGLKRLAELADSRGIENIKRESRELIAYSRRVLISYLGTKKGSRGTGSASLDEIPGESGAEIVCQVELSHLPETKLTFDFTRSSDQHLGCLNANEAIVRSAVLYSLRLFLPDDTPTTSGLLEPVKISLRKGSLLSPNPGAAVAGGNVETSQAIVEAVLHALGDCGWDVPASSQGTMNNVLLGGDGFSFYETIGGGAGAIQGYHGASGIQTHMTNTRNTPIEAIERVFPIRIKSYRIRDGSGGNGEFRGGDGIMREFEVLEKCQCTILSGHRQKGPSGIGGASDGHPGRNILIRDGIETELPSRAMIELNPGDVLKIETPGGGGYGLKRVV